jgi:hypothetical protein
MRRVLCGAVAIVALGASVAPAVAAACGGSSGPRVTICHATSSTTNPYVLITPRAAGVVHGHLGHHEARDIVPPFDYKGVTYSQNWEAGKATFDNGCVVPATIPPPDTGGGGGSF